MKYLSAEELIESGYLQEVNRCFLHPLGLALEVALPEYGLRMQEGRLRMQDHRSDLEGVIFDEGLIDRAKTQNISDEKAHRSDVRQKALGFSIQPPPAPHLPPPAFPLNRLIREGESVFCATCGSGRHAHRTGERAHRFEGPPTLLERIATWWNGRCYEPR